MKRAIRRLPYSLVASFRGRYAWAHICAIALTAIMVLTGMDWWYFEHTRGTQTLQYVMMWAGIIGFAVPVLVPLALLVLGLVRESLSLRRSAWIVAEAEAIAWLIASTYKAFTGRIQPEFWTHLNSVDISREFNFGFMEHGIFWGWPSAHAASACAMAAALCVLFPRNRYVCIFAPLYALYIMIGASISFHWLSDVLSGGLVGVAAALALVRLARA